MRLNETKVAKDSVQGLDLVPEAVPSDLNWTPDLTVALQGLPSNQRRAIELRYLSEWSFEQIAREMKTSPVNIRQMISRGIKKLRSGIGGGHE